MPRQRREMTARIKIAFVSMGILAGAVLAVVFGRH